jgi:hypothetical protein
MRKAYFEEYKIHSFNYIILLLESVNRIIQTCDKTEEQKMNEVE